MHFNVFLNCHFPILMRNIFTMVKWNLLVLFLLHLFMCLLAYSQSMRQYHFSFVTPKLGKCLQCCICTSSPLSVLFAPYTAYTCTYRLVRLHDVSIAIKFLSVETAMNDCLEQFLFATLSLPWLTSSNTSSGDGVPAAFSLSLAVSVSVGHGIHKVKLC